MTLPAHLTRYEFQRKLLPSQDVTHFYHLAVSREADGTPVLLPESESPYQPQKIEGLFGKPGPVEIEIGCGKGNFLVAYSEKHPQLAVLGIDAEPSIAHLAGKRVAKRTHLPHARVLCGDAFYFFRDFLPEDCVQAFHMYFPDPWPKKRHRTRRILTPQFLAAIHRVARPDSAFYWATDFAQYHEEAMDLFEATPWASIEIKEADPTAGIETNFEKKYKREGRPIYRSVIRIEK